MRGPELVSSWKVLAEIGTFGRRLVLAARGSLLYYLVMTRAEARQIFDDHQKKYQAARLGAIELAIAFPDAPYPTFARDMDRKFWEEVYTPEFDSLLNQEPAR